MGDYKNSGWFQAWLRNKNGDTIASRIYGKKHHIRAPLEKIYPKTTRISNNGFETVTLVRDGTETIKVITDGTTGATRYEIVLVKK